MQIATVDYHTVNQGSFRMTGNVEDISVFAALSGGTWEPHVVSAMEHLVKADAVCCDIGANIGALTVILSRLAPAGHIYAFELSGITLEILARNVAENGLANVTVIHAAIGEGEGEVGVDRIDAYQGCAHVMEVEGAQEVTPKIPLDLWRAKNGNPSIDFIKLDVEGEEVNALQGARRTIRECCPAMIVEYNPTTLEAFHGYPKRYLWDVLREMWPHVAVIEREGYRMRPLARWEELDALLPEQTWQDLVCSFSPIE
jgi:FkbM family methyltransferase